MISIRFRAFSILTFFALSSTVRAQGMVEADAAAFRLDTARCEVEIYYGVLEHALAFSQAGDVWVATVSARAEVWQNGVRVGQKDIHDTLRHPGTKAHVDSLGANKLLGTAGFVIPYGSTTTALFLWQRTSPDGQFVYDTVLRLPLTLPDRDASHLALGGIELASAAEKASGNASPFEKAGVVLTPNPSAVFGENYTKLFFYSEVYVPHSFVDPSQTVELISSVIDASGKEILTGSEKKPLAGETLPIVTALDIDGLSGDSYKLRIRLKHEDALVAEAEKPFYFTSEMKLSEEAPSQAAVDESVVFASSEFSKLTDAEADERLDQALYLASPAERKEGKTLKDVQAKQHFLYTFWRNQDAAQHNAFPLGAFHQFMVRVDSADRMFTHMKTPGWKSSRGRVMIIYGSPPPRGVQTHMVETGAKPYITWEYDPNPNIRVALGGGAPSSTPTTVGFSGDRPGFVFVDRQGGGNFVLVHSNVVGETYNANWYNQEALRLSH